MEDHVKAALRQVAEDWRVRHESGGDCAEFATEVMEILLPQIQRGDISREGAVRLSIAAGDYANGTDPETFTDMIG